MRRTAVLLSALALALAGWGFGAANDRIVAQFTIRPGGAVAPRTITVPARVPVLLTVVSADRRPHLVVLGAPHARPSTVPAHGRAQTRFDHLAAGAYPLKVDGARKATLVIGGVPGP